MYYLCVFSEFVQTIQSKIIAADYTNIIEEDGGVAMAQFANLSSRLFYVLFGQAPGEEGGKKQIKTRNKVISAIRYSKMCDTYDRQKHTEKTDESQPIRMCVQMMIARFKVSFEPNNL